MEIPLPVNTVTVSEEEISSASSSTSRGVAGLALGTTEAILLGSPETTAILGGGGAREGIGDLCRSGRATATEEEEVEAEVDADEDEFERCW